MAKRGGTEGRFGVGAAVAGVQEQVLNRAVEGQIVVTGQLELVGQ